MGEEEEEEMEKWIQHYSSSQKILLVGEGDFSFSACLAKHFGSAINMVATSLDSQRMVLTKYNSAGAHLGILKTLGCLVLHEVDVNEMNAHRILAHMKFDIIIFNFPHAGHVPTLGESSCLLITWHRLLMKGFFKSASEMLRSGGEVHVAHRDDYAYNRWGLEDLAVDAGLYLTDKVKFRKEYYPGYHNKRGGGVNSDGTFRLGDYCYTFIFGVILKKINTIYYW